MVTLAGVHFRHRKDQLSVPASFTSNITLVTRSNQFEGELLMLFDSDTTPEASLSTESNKQMLLFVAFVVLISIRSFLAEIAEALLSVVHLLLTLLPSAKSNLSEKPARAGRRLV